MALASTMCQANLGLPLLHTLDVAQVNLWLKQICRAQTILHRVAPQIQIFKHCDCFLQEQAAKLEQHFNALVADRSVRRMSEGKAGGGAGVEN